MDVAALRAVATVANFAAHAVAATVTRPAPDNAPIVTSAIWMSPVEDRDPTQVASFHRRDPRLQMALRRDEVPTLPPGTVIVAAEPNGGPERTWRFDGHEQRADPQCWYAFVVRTA